MTKNNQEIIKTSVLKELERQKRNDHFQEFNKHMSYKDKVIWSENKIKDFLIWCNDNKYKEILISFSGGKDSTVLFDLVNKVHLKMKSKIYLIPGYAIEITFPSTLKFINNTVKKYQKYNPYIKEPLLKQPKMSWDKILSEKGYPIFSKQISVMLNRVKNSKTKTNLSQWIFGIKETARFKLSKKRLFLLDDEMLKFPQIPKKLQDYFPENSSNNYFFSEKCCTYIKGGLKNDKRPAFVGTMASESALRKKSWIDNGCNILNYKKPMSRPLSLWNAKDIWKYIKENNLDVNAAYNFDHNLDLENQNLRFDRLGCTSCPYGSSIEQLKINVLKRNNKIDNELLLKNRFEKLYEYSPHLYKAQIINTGIFKILIDMGVEIHCDDKYQELFTIRQKQIANWYKEKNFRKNLLRVLTQIENHKNYKGFTGKYKEWDYTISEINNALNFFGVNKNVSKKELDEIREETKKIWNKKILK